MWTDPSLSFARGSPEGLSAFGAPFEVYSLWHNVNRSSPTSRFGWICLATIPRSWPLSTSLDTLMSCMELDQSLLLHWCRYDYPAPMYSRRLSWMVSFLGFPSPHKNYNNIDRTKDYQYPSRYIKYPPHPGKYNITQACTLFTWVGQSFDVRPQWAINCNTLLGLWQIMLFCVPIILILKKKPVWCTHYSSLKTSLSFWKLKAIYLWLYCSITESEII